MGKSRRPSSQPLMLSSNTASRSFSYSYHRAGAELRHHYRAINVVNSTPTPHVGHMRILDLNLQKNHHNNVTLGRLTVSGPDRLTTTFVKTLPQDHPDFFHSIFIAGLNLGHWLLCWKGTASLKGGR
ncbi:hypothetical protein HPB52_008576 [Rhipicephalus sanguineus]|uniref:Uncharacterized protein n=1 Tax=Rhipicephalus sanguineus TaxID=34632 RepID=A0A9D4PZ12_RHISA|nr:hypothetical protein HPB52_008576 [Rhipicephalus sanguineus]